MEDSGEAIFVAVFEAIGLTCTRISVSDTEREQRPDFSVVGSDGTQFIAEVKMVSPSPVEIIEAKRRETEQFVTHGGKPGERLRRFIGKANSQLKAAARPGVPGVLAVINVDAYLAQHIDPYSVLTAMRGLDVVDVSVPRNPQLRPTFGEARPGPGKKMTKEMNTNTSAIVTMKPRGSETWDIRVYHNRFAETTFPIGAIRGQFVSHFRMKEDQSGWDLCSIVV